MEFTIIDGIAAAIILISGILAYSRGFVRECLSIGGWVIAGIVAFMFAAQTVPLVREIPIIDSFAEGCEPATIIGAALIFAATLVIVSLFTPIFAGAIQRSFLGGIDQGLGFLFGVARGLLLVVVALVLYDRFAGDQRFEMVDNSKTAEIVGEMAGPIDDAIPTEAPGWITGSIEQLFSHCNAPATGSSDA